MCRILGYAGQTIALDTLLYAPPFSIERQSHAPRHQTLGRINADGWGVAWYDHDVREEPARYRTATPMWADQRFRDIAAFQRSGHVIAAVRNASPGAPIEETGSSPFVAGRYAFTHNGFVDGFREGLGTELRRGVSERRELGIMGAADSEVLFAILLDHLDKGAGMADAIRALTADLLDLTTGKFNFLLTDGRTMIGTRAGNSLFVRSGEHEHIVASEPFDDDPAWQPVDDHTLVTVTATGLTTERLLG